MYFYSMGAAVEDTLALIDISPGDRRQYHATSVGQKTHMWNVIFELHPTATVIVTL